MEKTIFTVFVPMQDQAQCDRMKQLCLDYGLPIWEHDYAFRFDNKNNDDCFCSTIGESTEFFVFPREGNYFDFKGKTQVTESDFINLLKEYKNGNSISMLQYRKR